jgi:REP element-mobilizing transposase RayT
MRNTEFANGEFYHIYNRGVDKRNIFSDPQDLKRWTDSIDVFNSVEPTGGLVENERDRDILVPDPQVNIIAYCFNPNHFHFLLEQVSDKGIERFMHRLGTGYTKYFNVKNKRSGSLFQGTYKAKHIGSNEYLVDLSVYINLNDKIHRIKSDSNLIIKSSWKEYLHQSPNGLCKPDIILDQFKKGEYEKYALGVLPILTESKIDKKELEHML